MASTKPLEGPDALPAFVFPARPTSISAPGSFAKPHTRAASTSGSISGMSGNNSNRRKAPELPAFSFNPSSNPDAYASPTSPTTGRSTPSRTPGGHRRGTSEFIGGDGKTGSSAGLMSSSPTKGDNILPPPSSAGLPGGRKPGHAHRRSAAISSHDLSFILKPTNGNALPRAGSAPTSPSDIEHKSFLGIEESTRPRLEQSHSNPDLTAEENGPVKPPTRARVGFSDDIEFIPRPLSLVSSDASSTNTIRPGHSVSNSMSSVVSGSVHSSPSAKGLPSPPLPDARDSGTRPRTAGAILDSPQNSSVPDGTTSPTKERSSPLLANSNKKGYSPTSPRFPSKKSWGFFGSESSSEKSPNTSRPSSSNSVEQMPTSLPPVAPTMMESGGVSLPSIERTPSRRSSINRKSGKKQKKVKPWAGILSRKARPRHHAQKSMNRRSPTPPLRSFAPMNEVALDSTNAGLPAVSNSEEVAADSTLAVISEPPQLKTNIATWQPRYVPQQEDESLSPMIDLDAALGPLNTPTSYDPVWEMAQNAGVKKRKMHSAMGMSNFTGAGMHYHRRAESAPEFENPRFRLGRLGSSSTMADVFEEDEEDSEWEDAKASDKESCTRGEEDETGLGIDINVVETANEEGEGTMDFSPDSTSRGVKRKGSGLSEGKRKHATSSLKSENVSIHERANGEDSSAPVEVVCEDGSRPNSQAHSSESVPAISNPRSTKALAPVDVTSLNTSTYLTPASPMSIVDSPRSPLSDTQRISSTAPSSVSEDQAFHSLLMGEPGPELVRPSVEDVPSLSSTNTTMTRDSGSFPPAHNNFYRDGQRSASMSGPTATKKRSSMASLSRLISSSHGEKSKLSIESRPASTAPDAKQKSKSNRISRMIAFWKPKPAN